MREAFDLFSWWAQQDSNLQPRDYESILQAFPFPLAAGLLPCRTARELARRAVPSIPERARAPLDEPSCGTGRTPSLDAQHEKHRADDGEARRAQGQRLHHSRLIAMPSISFARSPAKWSVVPPVSVCPCISAYHVPPSPIR